MEETKQKRGIQRITIALITAGILALGYIFLLPSAGAQEQTTHRFGGNARMDKTLAPQGTLIAAIIDERTVATTTASEDGSYIISVPGNRGDVIRFTVGGQIVPGTFEFNPGQNITRDLNAVVSQIGGTPGPTVTPAPTARMETGTSTQEIPTTQATSTPAPTAQVEAQPTPNASTTPTAPTIVPTPTLVPTADLEPTPTHTPSPANNTFRVGPTVNLRPVNDLIDQDKDGLVEAVFRNPALNDKPMVVEMSVSIPSGFHIYGEGLASDVAAGIASMSFTVQPGQSRNVYLNVKSEKVGTFTIHFSGLYWPENNKDNFKPISLTHPFTVRAPSRWPFPPFGIPSATAAPLPGNPTTGPTSTPVPTTAPTSDSEDERTFSCSAGPIGGNSASATGDMALMAMPLIGLAGMMLIARRRK